MLSARKLDIPLTRQIAGKATFELSRPDFHTCNLVFKKLDGFSIFK